jgi:aminoglycoside phosphotransferase (APT) family kinase protein
MISEPALDRLSGMFHAPDVSGTRYEILSLLGRGGMGVVYLARDTVLDREVALKVWDDLKAVSHEREADEARILARLEHPGIVPVHDFGRLPDGRLFYAMKRVRGDRLDRWMAIGRGVTERLGVFLRVCDAVAFAHAHGVVHRDLKPQNVMVGEYGEVLVLDWGIALQMQMADGELQIAGTPEYMAPEQARGDAAVDHRADVFALGAMLAGIAEVPALAAIAGKARSPDPADRYQDVPALAADVSRFLDGRAVDAHRESVLDRIARFGRRYRLPILLVLTYLVARVLLLWLMRP